MPENYTPLEEELARFVDRARDAQAPEECARIRDEIFSLSRETKVMLDSIASQERQIRYLLQHADTKDKVSLLKKVDELASQIEFERDKKDANAEATQRLKEEKRKLEGMLKNARAEIKRMEEKIARLTAQLPKPSVRRKENKKKKRREESDRATARLNRRVPGETYNVSPSDKPPRRRYRSKSGS